MIGGIDSPIYTNFARHLYRVRIKGTSLQNVYPTIELAYAAGFLGKEKPYNDVWIKIAVEGYDEKFLFKINTSDKDWFKDLNERVASRLGKPHVTVVFQGEALNEYTLYKIVHSNHSNVYSVEYRQANIPVFKPTSASSSSSTVLQRLSISQTDFASIIQGFLENALTDLSKQVSSGQSFSIEEWIEGFSAMSKEEVFDFIFNYYKTYQLQINGTPYRLMDIIAQQQPPVNVSHVANTFVGISRAFTSIILDNLNAKRSLQHDKKAAASLLRSSIKMFAAQYTARLVDALALSSSSSTGQREPLDDDDDDDNDREERDEGEREDEDVAQPIATELRFIGVKFNVPLPSLSGTANRLRNAKNSLVNATSKSKYVEFSLSPAASVEAGRGVKGRVLQLLQNVVSEVEPGDMLRYRILPGDEPKWVRVDIEENAADYRGNFSKDGWTIVTSNKIRRPSSVAFDAPYMTFPLVWARYRVRVYVERKDAVDRWKLEGERNFNCSVKGGKKGNEFTWAQLREVVANEELSAKLKVTKEIQSMRVSNRPPFVFRDIQGGPTISHFPKDAYKCLETAWQLDEEQQQDDSLALVFWSELKSYAQKKSQRILVARKLIWARFNNARLDASRYETESLYNPAYEDEYIHAPVVAKGECPYDDDEHQEAAEESISAWYNPLPPLTDANMGFGTAGSNTRTMVVDKRYQELNLPMAEKAELASESPAAQERQRRDLEFLVTKVVRPPVIVPTFSRSSSSSGRMSPSILTSSPPPSPVKNESEDEVDDLVLAPPPAAALQTLKESYLKNRRLSTNDIRVKRYEESITTEDEYRDIADSTEANVIVTVSIPVFLFTSAINLYTFKQVGSYSVEQRFIAGELKTEPGSEIPNLYGALFNDLTGQLNPYKVYFLVYDTRPGQIQARWVNATQELYQSISSKDSEVSAMILCEQTVFRENFNARRRLASILNVYGGQVKLDPNARFSPVSFVKFWVGRTPYPSANDSLASMTDAYVNLANLAVFTGLNTEKRIDDDGGIHLEIAYTTTIVHVDANGNTFITNVPVDSNSKDASLFDAFVIDENNYSIWFNHSTTSIDLSKVGDVGSPTTTNAIIDKGLGVFIVTLKNVQPPKDIAEKLRSYNHAARTLRDVVSKRYHNKPSNGWNVSPVEHKRLHTLLGAFIVVKPQDSGKGKGKAAASSGEEDELIPVTGRDQSSTEKLYALKKTFFVNRPLGYNDIVVWSGRKYITNDEELANAKEKLRTFVNIPVFRIESTETAYRLTQKETLIFESGSRKVNLVKSNSQETIGTYDFASFTTSFGGQSIRTLAYSNQGRVTTSLLDSDTFNSISEKTSDVFGIIISPPNRHEPKDHMFNNLIEKALNIYAERVVADPRQKVQPPNLKYVIFVVAGVQYLSTIDTSDEMLIAYMTFSNSKAFVNVEAELIPTSDPILLNVSYIARRIWIKSTGEVAVTNVNVLSFNYEQSLADLLSLESTQSVRIPYIDTNNEIAFANDVATTGDVVTRGFGVFVVTENNVTLSQEILEKLKTYLTFINRTQDAIKGRIADGFRKWMSAPDERNTENQLIEAFITEGAKPSAASSSSPSASSSAGTSSQTPPQSGVLGLVQRARSLLPGFSSSPPTPPTPVSLQPSSSSGAASSSSTSDTGRRSSKSSSSRGATSSSPPEQYYTYLPSSFTVGRGDGRVVTIPEFALDDTKNYGVKYTRDVKVGNTQISTSGSSSRPYAYTAGQTRFNKFFSAKNGVHTVTITEDGVEFNELTPALKLVGGVSTLWSTRNIVALLVSNNENLNLAEDTWVPPSLDAFKHAFMELKDATNEGRQAVFDMVKNRQFFANAFKAKEDTTYLVLEGQDPIGELITDLNEDIVPLLPRSLIKLVNPEAIVTMNQKPVDHEIPLVFDITVNVRVYFNEEILRTTVELRSNGLVTGGDVDLVDVDLSAFASTILGDAKFNDYNVVFMRTDDSPVTSVGDAVMKGTYAIVIHPQDGDYATAVDDLRVAYTQQLEIVLRDDDEERLTVYKRVFEDDIAVYDKNKIIGAEIIGDEHLPGCLEEWIGHYAKRGDILEEDGAHLILLPSDTRQLNEDIVAGRIDAEDHIEKYTHRFPFGDSFAKHARKLPPIEVNGQKLIVRRNFNKEAGRLELAIETENGHIHSVPVTTYVDEASRLVVSVPSSAFFKF